MNFVSVVERLYVSFQPKHNTKYIGKDKEKDFDSLEGILSLEIAAKVRLFSYCPCSRVPRRATIIAQNFYSSFFYPHFTDN